MPDEPKIQGINKMDKLFEEAVSEAVEKEGMEIESITGAKEADDAIKNYIKQFAQGLRQGLEEEQLSQFAEEEIEREAIADAIQNFGEPDITGMPEIGEEGETTDATAKQKSDEKAPEKKPAKPAQGGKKDEEPPTDNADKKQPPGDQTQKPAVQQTAPKTAPTEGVQRQETAANEQPEEEPEVGDYSMPNVSWYKPNLDEAREKKSEKPKTETPEKTASDNKKPEENKKEPSDEEQKPEEKKAESQPQPGQPNLPEGSRQMDKTEQGPQPDAKQAQPQDKAQTAQGREEGQEKTQEPKERSGLTQGINALRFRKQINDVDKNINVKQKEISDISKKMKKPLNEIEKMQRTIARRNKIIRLLKLIRIIMYVLSLLGFTLIIASSIKRMITVAEKERTTLEEKKKKLEANIKPQEIMITKNVSEIKALENERRTILNQSLI